MDRFDILALIDLKKKLANFVKMITKLVIKGKICQMIFGNLQFSKLAMIVDKTCWRFKLCNYSSTSIKITDWTFIYFLIMSWLLCQEWVFLIDIHALINLHIAAIVYYIKNQAKVGELPQDASDEIFFRKLAYCEVHIF